MTLEYNRLMDQVASGCLVRTFRSNVPPAGIPEGLLNQVVQPFDRGYAWIVRNAEPESQQKMHHPGTDPALGENEYIAAVILPEGHELRGKIRVKRCLTGMPEYDNRDNPQPFEKFRGGQCLIESVPAADILPYLVVWHWRGVGAEPVEVFRGEGVGEIYPSSRLAR